MAALVMVQIPLAYYLEEKWAKMKNRGTKIFFLACVFTGLGLYSFVIGSLSSESGRGEKANGEEGAPASQGRVLAIDIRGAQFNRRVPLDRRTSIEKRGQDHPSKSSNAYDWTPIARKYLRGESFKLELIHQLNRLSRTDLQKLSEKEWRTLRYKLARDPILHR